MSMKKLVLNKETLRSLNELQSQDVVGGMKPVTLSYCKDEGDCNSRMSCALPHGC